MPTAAGAPTRRVTTARILAPLALMLGYADLARGGLTIGPVLLVAAYLVLVPLALLDA